MIRDRIQTIQSMIEVAHKIPGQTKRQVVALKSKIETLADSHPDEAASITLFGAVSRFVTAWSNMCL